MVEQLPALQELQSLRQWVCWCLEKNKKGKLTKVPYNARTGYRASSTNPETWSSYEQALNAFKRGKNASSKPYNGVGFVLNNDYTVIDLDHCIDPATGKPNAWAQSVIERINSYTEYSPSGTGIHIIAKGTIPTAVKQPEIEMYCRDRFITISDNLLEGGVQ